MRSCCIYQLMTDAAGCHGGLPTLSLSTPPLRDQALCGRGVVDDVGDKPSPVPVQSTSVVETSVPRLDPSTRRNRSSEGGAGRTTPISLRVALHA